MDWVLFQTAQGYNLSPSQQPFFLSQSPPSLPSLPPPSPSFQSGFDIGNKISPSILLIIIILAVIFFISGLLHLLVRFLFRPIIRDPEDSDNVTALQGQLQQLFNLHDAGVDQSYIDTLPVFLYNAIKGIKNPFDCAVCLCEFEADDKLRLLPKCSHAFHLECIDTWLLSHSTCPLCRGSLLPDFSTNNSCSPVVFVLESGGESCREIILDRDGVTSGLGATNPLAGGTVTHMGFHGEDELGSSCNNVSQKFREVPIKDEVIPVVGSTEKVVPVKLGKFRNVDSVAGGNGEGSSNHPHSSSSNSNFDGRRCFSMGSFEYVMDESSSLEVAIRPPTRKQSNKKLTMPLTPGHRIAMSECDGHSVREGFEGFADMKKPEVYDVKNSIGNSIGRSKKESFSFSKIWLRSKKGKPLNDGDSSRRAFSFRFSLPQSSGADDLKMKNNNCSGRTTLEVDVGRWDNCVSELDYDEEVGSCKSLDSQSNLPSFARRTLHRLYGRQNKVVHSSPNV